jgi:hypothetical protein
MIPPESQAAQTALQCHGPQTYHLQRMLQISEGAGCFFHIPPFLCYADLMIPEEEAECCTQPKPSMMPENFMSNPCNETHNAHVKPCHVHEQSIDT